MTEGDAIIDTPPRKTTFDDTQIQAKFKHAKVVGVSGNYNKENAQQLADALVVHVANSAVEQIAGTFRGDPVIHYYDPLTKIDVMTSLNGEFISFWKLNEKQAENVRERGSL